MNRLELSSRITAKVLLAFVSAIGVVHAGYAQRKNLLSDERNTVDVFKSADRGVVHIHAGRTRDSKFEKEVREMDEGTGFVIDKAGHILTAFHVIEGMNQIAVILDNGEGVPARLIGTAPSLDIALLQITVPENRLSPLVLGNSETLEVGQKVLSIGNPSGLHNTLTVSVVSALHRSLEGAPSDLSDTMIQTDAAINPGNSGGPLLNSAGEVVGISDAIEAKAQNIGFAIPIHSAQLVLPDLLAMGHPYQPQLGFSGTELTPSIANLFGIPVESGFLVEQVLAGSPAAEAGLHAGERIVMVADEPLVLGGDIITEVDGNPIGVASQMSQALLESRPGQVLHLTVDRRGQQIEISIPLKKMQMRF